MTNIAVIPARGGSKRLPGKNILLLDGIPLIAHSIREAQRHAFIREVFVSTDDAEIKKIALSYGATVIDRPVHLSGDEEPTVTALRHVVENISYPVDTVFLLQATNPLRPTNLIDGAFTIFKESGSDSLMTVTRNHQKLGRIKDNVFIPFNYSVGQRSQDLEPLYFENGLLYIIKSEVVLAEKIMGEKHFPMIVEHPFAHIDIDTREDFDYAACLVKNENLK
jgi:CMP-N-acetylneuraminic acid synthetase